LAARTSAFVVLQLSLKRISHYCCIVRLSENLEAPSAAGWPAIKACVAPITAQGISSIFDSRQVPEVTGRGPAAAGIVQCAERPSERAVAMRPEAVLVPTLRVGAVRVRSYNLGPRRRPMR